MAATPTGSRRCNSGTGHPRDCFAVTTDPAGVIVTIGGGSHVGAGGLAEGAPVSWEISLDSSSPVLQGRSPIFHRMRSRLEGSRPRGFVLETGACCGDGAIDLGGVAIGDRGKGSQVAGLQTDHGGRHRLFSLTEKEPWDGQS